MNCLQYSFQGLEYEPILPEYRLSLHNLSIQSWLVSFERKFSYIMTAISCLSVRLSPTDIVPEMTAAAKGLHASCHMNSSNLLWAMQWNPIHGPPRIMDELSFSWPTYLVCIYPLTECLMTLEGIQQLDKLFAWQTRCRWNDIHCFIHFELETELLWSKKHREVDILDIAQNNTTERHVLHQKNCHIQSVMSHSHNRAIKHFCLNSLNFALHIFSNEYSGNCYVNLI